MDRHALDEKLVADFYSKTQFPGPDALITYLWAQRLKPYLPDTPFTLLDAGCGTGRHTAGFLDLYPNCNAVCLDAAKTSLEAAASFFDMKKFSERVELINQSYLEPITLKSAPDFAIAIGTIHHCPDAKRALKNIVEALKPGGILGLMVYSERSARRRYEIKEAISLLGISDSIETTGNAIREYKAKYEGIFDRPFRTVARDFRNKVSHKIKTLLGIRRHGYRYDLLRDNLIADAYLSPIDIAFNTDGIRELVEAANVEVLEFVGHGRMNEGLLPPSWLEPWHRLDYWGKVRILELLDPSPTSWSAICKKPA